MRTPAFHLLAAAALSCTAPMMAHAHGDADRLTGDALVDTGTLVDCTLENGDRAHCMSYTVQYLPETLDIGPFCPATLEEVGGIWSWDGDNAGLYRIDGLYLKMLAELGYVFYDDEGVVNVFDIRIEGPDATHECIAGSADTSVEMTMLIPTDPVMATAPTPLGTVAKVGIALDGVPIFADAPSVLETGHMPALDTCGGHVDPGGWYHWHATATDINSVFANQGVDASCVNVGQDATAQFAYAFDGFAIYGSREADGTTPTGLDACGGHVGPVPGQPGEVYHYHASDNFPNLPKCLVGVVARNNFTTTAEKGIGSARDQRRSGRPGPDFQAIAAELGIEATDLRRALRLEGGPRAELTRVADRLGVSLDALKAAMPRRR